MQRGVGAHRVTDDVRLVDTERVHHRDHVVTGEVLRVAGRVGGYVRGWISALTVGDAAMLAAEMAQLRFPAAIVAGILVNEDDRRARPDLFHVELYAVGGGNSRHCGAFANAKEAHSNFVCVQTKG